MTYQSHRPVRVPDPCHEDWGKMTPNEKGRFCQSCAKTVVDFTDKSALEIQRYMAENSGKRVCGHFKKRQLAPDPIVIRWKDARKPSSLRWFAMASFLVFGLTLYSCVTNNGEQLQKEKPQAEIVQVEAPVDSVEVRSYLPADTLEKIAQVDSLAHPVGMMTGVVIENSCSSAHGENIEEFTLGDVEVEGEVAWEGEEILIEPEPLIEGEKTHDGKQKQEPLIIVDEMPTFPGGERALMDWLIQNLRYPKEMQDAGVQGKVYVEFVVSAIGKVEEPKILRGIAGPLDEEALRVIREMPDWIPGKHRGKEVPVIMRLPIRFSLH